LFYMAHKEPPYKLMHYKTVMKYIYIKNINIYTFKLEIY